MPLQTLIFILSALAIIGGVLLMLLTRSQKKNKKYIRKEVRYYALASLLIFALMGFLALSALRLRELFWVLQALMIGAGILHAWLTYTLFLWPSRSSFGPETLLTIVVTLAASIGFIGGYWAVDHFLNKQEDGPLRVLMPALLWVPVPYLILRTFDYLMMIPRRLYGAWRFPQGPAPEMGVEDYVSISVTLSRQFSQDGRPDITCDTKLPRQESLERFFHRFVRIYNEKNPAAQIQDIESTPQGDVLGWAFYTQQEGRSRKQYLSPHERGAAFLQAGDTLFAERLKIDPEYQPPSPPPNRDFPSKPDDGNSSNIEIREI